MLASRLFAMGFALASGVTAAHAQNVDIAITEAGAPKAKPWEKAALLSVTIDRAGKDYFDAHVNAEVEFDLSPKQQNGQPTTTWYLGPSFSWDRSNKADKKQNELKAGISTKYFIEPDVGAIPDNSNPLFISLTGDLSYSRAAVYADLTAAPCDLTPAIPVCQVQYKESIKAKAAAFPFFAEWEDITSDKAGEGFAYSVRPQFQVAHEQITDATIDAATGQKVTGGYSSALAGVGVNFKPKFIRPSFELNFLGQLRQRVAASSSRKALIEKTAEFYEVSLTYFLAQDDGLSTTKNWRAGVSLIWTEGSDPYENKPKASTIAIAFRLGRF